MPDADKDVLVWECGPHINAWNGHDARCRQVPAPQVDEPHRYRCVHCGKVVTRRSTKAWIKSLCEATGKTVHLTRLTQPGGFDA